MKWGNSKALLDQAQRDGITTLGQLRAWLRLREGEPEQQPALDDADEAALQALLDRIRDTCGGSHDA